MKILIIIYQLLRRSHALIPYYLTKGWALPPLRVTFEVTYRCNLACQMCYLINQRQVKDKTKQSAEELSTSQLKEIIEALPSRCLITFTGGEPLLRKDIPEVISYASQRHRTTLITNGTLIDEKTAEQLVASGLWLIGVSLNGTAPLHDSISGVPGAFELTTSGIKSIRYIRKKLGRKRPIIDVKVVIIPENLGILAQIFQLAEHLGVEICTFQMMSNSVNMNGLFLSERASFFEKPEPVPALDTGKLERQLNLVKKIARTSKTQLRLIPDVPIPEIIQHYQNQVDLENFNCLWPWSTTRVSAAGFVFPCYNYSMGNLKEVGLGKIWNSPRYRDFRMRLKKAGIFPGCIGCCMLEYRPNVSGTSA